MRATFEDVALIFLQLSLPPDITYLLLDVPFGELKGAIDCLSEEEREQASLFNHPKRKHSFILGRAAARQLAGRALNLPPPQIPLLIAPDGAPYIDSPKAELSIAHSDHKAVAAFSRTRQVGIDLEAIRTRHSGLKRFLLHPQEYAMFEALALDYDSSIILCWTLKEATLKAMRTGFRVSPKTIQLSIDVPSNAATAKVEGGAGWKLWFEIEYGFILSIAYSGRVIG